MSYPLSLDEIPEETLRDEIARREKRRGEGNCDYCGRPFGVEPACKFPDRHDNFKPEFVEQKPKKRRSRKV